MAQSNRKKTAASSMPAGLDPKMVQGSTTVSGLPIKVGGSDTPVGYVVNDLFVHVGVKPYFGLWVRILGVWKGILSIKLRDAVLALLKDKSAFAALMARDKEFAAAFKAAAKQRVA